jgi:hypothetical protein
METRVVQGRSFTAASRVRRLGRMVALLAMAAALRPAPAGAHGMVGQRFFPATLTIDDPFVADELSLPTVQSVRRKSADDLAGWETEISAELSKRLSRNFGLSMSGTLIVEDPMRGPTIGGFDNLEVSAKYVFWHDPAHELLVSAGVEAEVGGTGQKRIAAASVSVVSPQLFFGKGMGDLPDALAWLRPLAVTGAFGIGLPTSAHTKTKTVGDDGEIEVEEEQNARDIEWGFSLQYNLQYLQSFVRDVGLTAPLNRTIPIVEFAMDSAVQGQGHTSGSINPGVLWFGRYMQLALEAVIPVNGNAELGERKQGQVGCIAQVHFYIDDIWPEVFTWTPFSGVLGPTQPR